MRVHYTSDNEPATVMDLETLVSNFNISGGWTGCTEVDMRDELNSRGWYEGLHECGRYLVLNLDKFHLEYRDPAMDEEAEECRHGPYPNASRKAAAMDWRKDVDLFDDVLDILANNDGACLYWQMPDVARGKAAAASGAVKWSGDLLVHPDAVEVEPELAFTMNSKGS